LLPDDIVHRPKKGFSLPWPLWLKGELRTWCEGNLRNIALRPEFNAPEIQRISQQFYQNSTHKGWMAVFELAVLEEWLKKNLDDMQ
jgi:asparagine synthase (glutamine-hydrolysing)